MEESPPISSWKPSTFTGGALDIDMVLRRRRDLWTSILVPQSNSSRTHSYTKKYRSKDQTQFQIVNYGDWICGIWRDVIGLNALLLAWTCKDDSAAICCCRNCCSWGCLEFIALKAFVSSGKSDVFSIFTCTRGLSLSIFMFIFVFIPGRGVGCCLLLILSHCCCWKARYWGLFICCICGFICLGICETTRVNEEKMQVWKHIINTS